METYLSSEQLKREKVHPLSKANIFSRLFFTWLNPLLYKGLNKEITEDDLFPNLKQHDATVLGDKLEKQWQKELIRTKNPSLLRPFFAVFGVELTWLALLFAFIELFARLSQPLLLSQLLKFYEPNTTMTKNEAILYSALIVASPAIVMLCQHNFMWYQLVLGVKIKIAATTLVYRKALKLSRSALAETNIGQMVNLISNDVARFENLMKDIHPLWLSPIELLIILVLLYLYVGPYGLTGILLLLLFIPFQMWLGKKTSIFRLNTALRTDERIRLMNEIISGIQVIKMYTWEKPFAKLVEISRRKEMQQIKNTAMIRAAVYSFHLFINKMAIYFCVLVYVLTGNTLNAPFVYVITSFYSILRLMVTRRFPEGVTYFAEAQISTRRFNEFLLMEEIGQEVKHKEFSNGNYNNLELVNGEEKKLSNGYLNPIYDPKKNNALIELKDVCVKWVPKSNEYSIENISLRATSAELTIVIGPVGGGKTTLLHAILKELPALKGSIQINGSISYASQEPWLFMSSIRQNILFGEPFDETRYNAVVKVCALERDFTLFPYGDKTSVGDRGVSLSGGQRARINLARAIYKAIDIYLLDDPLSAVDAHVGKQIFQKCIQGFLKDKCVVLVTHQLQYLKGAKKIYLLDDGKLIASGTYETIRNSSHDYAKLLVELNNNPNSETMKADLDNVDKEKISEENIGQSKAQPKISKETKAIGNVDSNVYITFFQNGGHWCKAFSIFLLFFTTQGMHSLSDYYLTWWVNAEALKQANSNNSSENYTSSSWLKGVWTVYLTDDLSIVIYSCIIISLIVLTLSRSMFFFRFALKASTTLHNNMFDKIVYGTMRFFNTNPSGRILNRFSHDMNEVDEKLPSTMINCAQNGLSVLFTTIVIATVNPWMCIPTVVISGIFYYLRVVYISTSRDVKRIESITRSPVYTHLAASLQGLTTIRAFGAEEILKTEFDRYQNRNTAAAIIFIGLARTFGFWLDSGCVIYICFVTMSFLLFNTDTLGGSVGLSITQSMTLTGMFQMCIRQWSELENQMTSVERIKEYVDVTPEKDSGTTTPPKDWPSQGEIVFKDLSMKYAVEESYVLKNLHFLIKSREKIGIVGRTGAGKSSIIMALFRLARNEGLIAIDNIDISSVPLERLRSSISIIPQEPVLFSGTLRKNLDPFDEYSDEILWNALQEVELKDAIIDLPHGLESRIFEGGSNFSVGQRQLVCLARAIIRKNKILVMDEATANVDPQTDALIQDTIRKKFAECTVLTIAHRLHTIMDSDKVLVMDAGKSIEFGPPFELLQMENGVFVGMVKQTGNAMADNLMAIAAKKYHGA
ncbi:probable multidrug resistance-associated protein lethal(2)03659 isoform X2 [Anthonomus grandis grandis]|uniref:probable multidrug resistance-associated protein lethal(2)03659 isoform X2 n=1 Tax=Anthonomus grandis grandis TaxID=2921223 RepID=UPI0021662D55|nr:probable multidrug resistance-associated protein lethal(2)03659 isoform X2 [Anthonomus grandis grandis]